MAAFVFCALGGSSYLSTRTAFEQCFQRCELTEIRQGTIFSIRAERLHHGRKNAANISRSLTLNGDRCRSFYTFTITTPKRNVSLCATTEEIEATRQMVEEDAKERMEKALVTVQSNYNGLRTGRANPLLLDRIQVEYYGSPVPLKNIAQVTVPDPTSLLVQPYDKSVLKDAEKAILKSKLGLNPMNDGNVIRVNLPQLTSERRKELLKVAGKIAEEGKVAIRNIRKDALKSYQKLEKEKKLSEDNVRDLSNDFQKLTDDYVKKVDALYKQKEKELTTI